MVVHRTAAVPQSGVGPDRLMDKLLGARDSVAQRETASQCRRDSRRIRAAGAVGVPRLDPHGAELTQGLAIPQHIRGVACEMAALDQDRARSQLDRKSVV